MVYRFIASTMSEMWRSVSKTILNEEIRNLNKFLCGEIITDHAGEIGAVYIYYGAKHALLWRQYFINKQDVNINKLSSFVNHHLESEQIHSSFFNEIMPSELHTNLVPFWMLLGYFVGYVSMSMSPHFFYKTVEYIEEFVVKHYQKQINAMKIIAKESPSAATPNLQKILQSFCNDEDEHRKQGYENAVLLFADKSYEYLIWKSIIHNGSDYSTLISKYCKGYK